MENYFLFSFLVSISLFFFFFGFSFSSFLPFFQYFFVFDIGITCEN